MANNTNESPFHRFSPISSIKHIEKNQILVSGTSKIALWDIRNQKSMVTIGNAS